MSDGASPTVQREKLRPIDPATTRVTYQITITKTTAYETHKQDYTVVESVREGESQTLRNIYGYATTHGRASKTETVFDAQVSRMPSLVALAKLVEPEGV